MAKNPYSLREIFEKMEMDLIASQKRNFMRHTEEELLEGFQWGQWQAAKLRSIRAYQRENKKIVSSYSKDIESTVKEVLQTNFKRGEGNVERSVQKAKKFIAEIVLPENTVDPELIKKYTPEEIANITDTKELLQRAAELPHAGEENAFFSINSRKLEVLQESVITDMKKAQGAILRKMDDVYRQTLFRAQVYFDAGAATIDKAVDMATKDFLTAGINCITYKDGKQVNVASYAEMSLRTASQRATFLGEGSKREEWGVALVAVTHHGNTCDLCMPWQGKILIDDVYSGGKPDGKHSLLSAAMAAGLLHPNCRHTLATYFPGVTQLPSAPVDDEKAQQIYEAEQKQRYMERQIRRYSRLEAGSIDEENRTKYGGKVRAWKGALNKHLAVNDQLRRNSGREKVRVA